jgi:hypothetical protein
MSNLKIWFEEQPMVSLVSNADKQWRVLSLLPELPGFSYERDIEWRNGQDQAILDHYNRVWSGERGRFQVAILEDIQRLAAKGYSFALSWDRGAGLSASQVDQVLQPNGLDTLSEELHNLNFDGFWQQRNDKANELLKDQGLDSEHPLWDVLRDYALEEMNELLFDDTNIKDLMRGTSAWGFTLRPNDVETWMQGWSGIRELEDIESICELLNVSPHHLQELVACEGLFLPEIPERNGNEYIEPKQLYSVFAESIGGGQLVFLLSLDLEAWVFDGDQQAAETRGVIVKAGTPVTIHDYCNGATSCGDGTLIKDLTLLPGSYVLDYDRQKKYGIQSCCGLTVEAWDGSIEVPPENHEYEPV